MWAWVKSSKTSGYWNCRLTGVTVAGGLEYTTAYLLDGAVHNDMYDNLNMPLPFPDALQEFKVETGGLSARRFHW